MMVTADIPIDNRRQLMNTLYNKRVDEMAKIMTARELARSDVDYVGGRIEFSLRGQTITGSFDSAAESGNGDVCLEVDGEFKLTTGSREVKVWAPKSPNPRSRPLQTAYHHLAGRPVRTCNYHMGISPLVVHEEGHIILCQLELGHDGAHIHNDRDHGYSRRTEC